MTNSDLREAGPRAVETSEAAKAMGETQLGWRGQRWLLLGLCLFAVCLRLVAVHQFESEHPLADSPVIDEASYDGWAQEIAAGDWLGDEVFFQEPLYPYFLGSLYAVAGHDRQVARVVQCLLGGLSVLLLWLGTRRLFGSLAAWFAGIALALHPPAILMACLLLKPNLFLPILAGFVVLLVTRPERRSTWLWLGVLGGLGALLRGNMLILLPVLTCLPWLRIKTSGARPAQALRSSALFVAGGALVLLPVMLRNWQVGEVFALTTSGAGTNVYGGNNADNPYGVATEFDWVRGIPRYEAEDWRREAEARNGREMDAGESSDYWLGQTIQSMQADPALHLSIFWNKLRLALGSYEVPDNHHLGWDSRYVSLLRLRWPSFAIIGGFGLAGLLLLAFRRGLSPGRLELALLFVLYLGTIVLTVMSMRARLPLTLLILPFMGYWMAQLYRAYDEEREPGEAWRRKPMRIVALVLLGTLCTSFVVAPVFDEQHLDQDLADRDYNLAVSWLERGEELERASSLSAELATRFPQTSRFQTLLATTEWRRGRLALDAGNRVPGQELIRAALARLEPISKASGVSPRERSRALRLAGYIQADIGNWSPAERFFRQAREFAGADLELMVSHAQALLEVAKLGGDQADAQVAVARDLLQDVIRRSPEGFEADGARALLEGLN